MENLEKQIKSLETDLNENDDSTKQRELLLLRTQYNKLSADKAANSLLWLKQSYYDQGEKAGKLLAWRIKKMQSDRSINSVINSSGDLTVDPQEINNCFREFFEHLYRSECIQASEERDQFLCQLQFLELTEDLKDELDSGLTVEELSQAIQNINSGKVPGPDGLPIEFYKTFRQKLLTPLLNMYNESYQNETLPPSLRLAIITLILKPGKSSTECSSYRPISLLGADTKILCKALAMRLDPHIPLLIHNDQNGFVKQRQGFHTRDVAILSMDTRQAFDRIEWPYLFNVLSRFGFGNNFLKWI